MKIIDLSIPIEDGLPSDPPQQIPHIQYLNHKDTAQIMTTYFHGGLQWTICLKEMAGPLRISS